MPGRHVVVDGSNIATEGRNLPSLAQLDQAVREYLTENPEDTVTVVVDASFAHRIDPSELATFEEAEEANEVVSPPAGAIGRGDAFLLRIADKTGATVLSNDSFQEFHGEYDWLFNNGRLVGGKPVPGVGWIFTPRTPVRGPKSREAVKEAKRRRTTGPATGTGLDLAAARGREGGVRRVRKVAAAIATATEEAEATEESAGRRRRTKSGSPPADPVNEPLAFITFIAAHPLGGEVSGVVDSFSSHGAFVDAEGARCYVPLSAMGHPPPRKGRDVLSKGEQRTFVVQALDPLRRGIELALPGFAKLAGAPTAETVEAEITVGETAPRPRKRAAKAVAVEEGQGKEAVGEAAPAPAPAGRAKAGSPRKRAVQVVTDADPAPSEEAAPTRKAAAKKSTPTRKAAAKKALPGTGPEVDGGIEAVVEAAAEKVAAKKVRAKKAPAEKVAAEELPAKVAAKRAPAEKGATEKVAAEKGAAKEPTGARTSAEQPETAKATSRARARKVTAEVPATEETAPTKKAAATKKAAPARASAQKATTAKKAPAAKKATTAKKAAPTKKATTAKKVAAAKKARAVEKVAAPDQEAPPSIAGRRSPRRTAAASGDPRGSTGRA